jgi:hypothetical protein
MLTTVARCAASVLTDEDGQFYDGIAGTVAGEGEIVGEVVALLTERGLVVCYIQKTGEGASVALKQTATPLRLTYELVESVDCPREQGICELVISTRSGPALRLKPYSATPAANDSLLDFASAFEESLSADAF